MTLRDTQLNAHAGAHEEAKQCLQRKSLEAAPAQIGDTKAIGAEPRAEVVTVAIAQEFRE